MPDTTTPDQTAATGTPERRLGVGGRHDDAARRRAKRAGRERGCWIYIPGEALAVCGVDPYGDPPFYRTWPAPRGRLAVQLYRQG